MEPFLKVQHGIKGVFYTLSFFRSAGEDDRSTIRRTPPGRVIISAFIVLERRDSTARIACNKRGQEQRRACRAKKCDVIFRS